MGGGDGAGESIMVKLVVSDLDGTLIDSSEQLTDTAREMARWLKDRNVLFTFATGRVQGMTERYAQDMQVSIPYVATNGAALIAPDGVLFRRKVPLKPLETMLRKADSMGMSIIYSEDGYEKVCRETPYILRQRAAFGRYNDVAPLTQADYDGKQMEKICVMDSDKPVIKSTMWRTLFAVSATSTATRAMATRQWRLCIPAARKQLAWRSWRSGCTSRCRMCWRLATTRMICRCCGWRCTRRRYRMRWRR